MVQYVYFNISTLLMDQMCLFYAIEKKMNSEHVSLCTISIPQCIGFPSTPLC